MATEDRPSEHCSLETQVDLSAVFDRLSIEHLPFEADRAYVIYDQAILKVVVNDGQLTAASAFETECWDTPNASPDAVLTSFLNTVIAATSSDRDVW
jgi:hypothetical protein